MIEHSAHVARADTPAQPVGTPGRPAGIILDGPRLRRARETLGITRDQLAQIVGVNPRTIQRAENGRPVSHRVMCCLCDHFGLSTIALRKERQLA